MACLCCEPRHRSASARWHPAHVWLPTNVAEGAPDSAPGGAPSTLCLIMCKVRPPASTNPAASKALSRIALREGRPGVTPELPCAATGERGSEPPDLAFLPDLRWERATIALP